MVILMNYASLPEYSVAIPKPVAHIYTRELSAEQKVTRAS